MASYTLEKAQNDFVSLSDDPTTLGAMVEAATGFAQDNIRPLDDEIQNPHAFPHPLWAKMGGQTLLSICTPADFGGLGQGYLPLVMVTEEISRASGSIGLSYIAHTALCTNQIILHGTNEQKEKYLPGLGTGELIGALAMSEAGAGSDVLGSMLSTADKTDGGHVINGQKLWITNGARIDETTRTPVTADVMIEYALTSRNPRKATAFIVEGGTEGFRPGQKLKKQSMRGSETWEMILNNCFVPDTNVLGDVGRGANVLMTGLNPERLMLSAGALGLARAALEEGIKYTEARKQFGRPVSANQAVAHELADIWAEVDAARRYTFMTALMADKKPDSLTNEVAAAVFLQASKAATRATLRCQHFFGGYGLTTDFRIGRLADDAKLYPTGGGTEEMRREIIARSLMPAYNASVRAEQGLRAEFGATQTPQGPTPEA